LLLTILNKSHKAVLDVGVFSNLSVTYKKYFEYNFLIIFILPLKRANLQTVFYRKTVKIDQNSSF